MVKYLFFNGYLSILLGYLIYFMFYGVINEVSGLYYKKYVYLFMDILIYKLINYYDIMFCSEKCIFKRIECMNYMEFLV